jgi:hypothetical protein
VGRQKGKHKVDPAAAVTAESDIKNDIVFVQQLA